MKDQQPKRRIVEEEVQNMWKKKVKLVSTVAHLMSSADTFADKAEETGDITLIVKSNSLRKTAKTKKEELLSLSQEITENNRKYERAFINHEHLLKCCAISKFLNIQQ